MVELKLKSYLEQLDNWPNKGRFILCQQTPTSIVVYQSYNQSIGRYATKHQKFIGCKEFSLSRMSWIKTNFLWMMYRNGWASKANQETVLAIYLNKDAFYKMLSFAVVNSSSTLESKTKEERRKIMIGSNVRLQWDPDHDPFGTKTIRRAVQIGIRGEFLEAFARGEIIEEIKDITDFVVQQGELLNSGNLKNLVTPEENIYFINDKNIRERIGLDVEEKYK